MQQILWFELLLKGAAGLLLILVPLTSIRSAGLDRPGTGFWPRLVGGILLGLAAAVYVTLSYPEARGALGAAGLVPVNLAAAAMMIAPLIMGTAAPTRRGRLFILAMAIVSLTLAFLEIAHI